MEHLVQIFKALGDETRLKILIILSKRTICAKGIAKHLGVSEAAVSQHLKVLKDAGIIVGEKTGYYVYYNIQEPVLLEIVHFIEQINSKNNADDCPWDMPIPHDCRVECKGKQRRCCQRKLNYIHD